MRNTKTKSLLLIGIGLIIGAITIQMFVFPSVWIIAGTQKSFILIDLFTYGTALLHFSGFVTICSAFQAHKSVLSRFTIAAILYVTIGIAYFIIERKIISHPAIINFMWENPSMFLWPLLWPLNILEPLRPFLFYNI